MPRFQYVVWHLQTLRAEAARDQAEAEAPWGLTWRWGYLYFRKPPCSQTSGFCGLGLMFNFRDESVQLDRFSSSSKRFWSKARWIGEAYHLVCMQNLFGGFLIHSRIFAGWFTTMMLKNRCNSSAQILILKRQGDIWKIYIILYIYILYTYICMHR